MSCVVLHRSWALLLLQLAEGCGVQIQPLCADCTSDFSSSSRKSEQVGPHVTCCCSPAGPACQPSILAEVWFVSWLTG